MTRTIFHAVLLFIGALFFVLAIAGRGRAADYYPAPPPRRAIIVSPPVVVAPPEPRCAYEREIDHDDILDTTDWTSREMCDED